jgi:hypothetical protein
MNTLAKVLAPTTPFAPEILRYLAANPGAGVFAIGAALDVWHQDLWSTLKRMETAGQIVCAIDERGPVRRAMYWVEK